VADWPVGVEKERKELEKIKGFYNRKLLLFVSFLSISKIQYNDGVDNGRVSVQVELSV
jgi:hypothetical protein